MYKKDDKTYYDWIDYGYDMKRIKDLEFDHVVGIYRGSLTMAVHISNVFDVSMSIVGFQTRDGEDKGPYWIHNATPLDHSKDVRWSRQYHGKGSTILIVDDIYDTGHTMHNVIPFVKVARNKPSAYPNLIGYCLFGKANDKNISYANEHDGSWIVFPWETLNEPV